MIVLLWNFQIWMLVVSFCPLVGRMDGIVEVHAGQDRKDVSLQECNEKFECCQRHGKSERQNCANDTNKAKL